MFGKIKVQDSAEVLQIKQEKRKAEQTLKFLKRQNNVDLLKIKELQDDIRTWDEFLKLLTANSQDATKRKERAYGRKKNVNRRTFANS